MKVLVACEESQAVATAFRQLGHEAFSCDILPCSGGHPEYHIRKDVTTVIFDSRWDLIIAFPPCTYLTTTGNRWFDVDKYGEKARWRLREREKAIDFFSMFYKIYEMGVCSHVAIENPIGVMSTHYRKPDQIIEPFQFGHPVEKRTCLWLHGLPLLVPTEIVTPESRKVFNSGKSMPAWYAESWNLPKDERATFRSKTFSGVANAMAEQWSHYLMMREVNYD